MQDETKEEFMRPFEKKRHRRNFLSAISMMLLLGAAGFTAGRVLAANVEKTRSPASKSSTAADSSGTNLTIYNSGRALVTDRRNVDLPLGTVELRFSDVAQQIMPETVAIKSLSAADSLAVLEQNYEYDLLSPKKILDKYVGHEVTLVTQEMRDNTTVEKKVTAILLANNEQPVWKIGDRIVTGNYAARYEFPEVPENLIAHPTLVWLLTNDRAKSQEIEASYLTNGISWKSDYVFVLDSDERHGGLEGWVTINNGSGATYKNARLQLIAGDVHQVESDRGVAYGGMMKAAAAREESFAEKSFFEYHLYTLQRPATVKENSQKQISLLSADGVSVEKLFRLSGQKWYYQQQYGGDKQKIQVALRLRNSKENRMGMALPKGTVRVYKHDTDGSSQFIGEDQIDHTPKDETVDLVVGNAFDIVAERKQTDFKILGSCTYEMAYEISIRNHKDSDVTIVVSEPIGGDWEILEETHKHTKTAAFSAEFRVPVAKDGETKLRYRIRVRYC